MRVCVRVRGGGGIHVRVKSSSRYSKTTRVQHTLELEGDVMFLASGGRLVPNACSRKRYGMSSVVREGPGTASYGAANHGRRHVRDQASTRTTKASVD